MVFRHNGCLCIAYMLSRKYDVDLVMDDICILLIKIQFGGILYI